MSLRESPRLERALIALTPVVALATVGVGLRIGASHETVGARVYMTAPGEGRPGMALQIATLMEEGGVPEVMAVPGLRVSASMPGEHGGEAEWSGASNVEGVAEAWLDLPRVSPSDRVGLSIVAGDGRDLGTGVLVVPTSLPPGPLATGEVHATKRTGELVIEAFVLGGKLVPGASERIFLRVRDEKTGRAAEGAKVTVEPEPGLTLHGSTPATSAGGWTEARVTADFLNAGWTVTATAGPTTGTWFGSLPVAPGAATSHLPDGIEPGAAFPLRLEAPPATHRLYVEVDDARGRDFATVVEMEKGANGVANTQIPSLTRGVYWLVVSPGAHGAESMSGASIARPFRVGPAPAGSAPPDALLAELVPPTFTRTMVLDGLVLPRKGEGDARRKGMTIALLSLAIATVLECLLVYRAGRRAQRRMVDVEDAAREVGVDVADETAGGRVAVLVLVTLLGFALIAGLLLMSSGS